MVFALLMVMMRLKTDELPLVAAQDEMMAPERLFTAERV
jgi:hypothetical protein